MMWQLAVFWCGSWPFFDVAVGSQTWNSPFYNSSVPAGVYFVFLNSMITVPLSRLRQV
jgi:hypothetical protein